YGATFSPTGPPPSTTTSAVRSAGSEGAVAGAEESWSAMPGTVGRGRLHVTGADRTARQRPRPGRACSLGPAELCLRLAQHRGRVAPTDSCRKSEFHALWAFRSRRGQSTGGHAHG